VCPVPRRLVEMGQRYSLTVEFDGSAFSGWQKQKDARSVQGDLLKAAARVVPDGAIDLQGCGRTDAGVHALAYIAHLDIAGSIAADQLLTRLNEELPKDIAVLAIAGVADDFHARHSCLARSYLYQLRTRKSAFGKRNSWWLRDPLDIEAMRRAAAVMCGMHDFRSFAEKQELKRSTQVLVHAVQLHQRPGLILVRVVASHFLWRMVRRMVGVLVAVGSHQLDSDHLHHLVTGRAEQVPAVAAPAAGLFFERAFYAREELQRFLAAGEDPAIATAFSENLSHPPSPLPAHQGAGRTDERR
jgi:tRNA pseudouridine38-40 synthase